MLINPLKYLVKSDKTSPVETAYQFDFSEHDIGQHSICRMKALEITLFMESLINYNIAMVCINSIQETLISLH